jgi:hypothetical protein
LNSDKKVPDDEEVIKRSAPGRERPRCPDCGFVLPGVSSKLALDAKGRKIVVITSPTEPHLEPGRVFFVFGDDLRAVDTGVYWMGATGRQGRLRLPDATQRAERGSPRPARDP